MSDFGQNEYQIIRLLERKSHEFSLEVESARERGDEHFSVFYSSFKAKLDEIIEEIRQGEHLL